MERGNRVTIEDLNLRDLTFILANLRKDDQEEINAMLPTDMTWHESLPGLISGCQSGLGYIVLIDGLPAAAFGAGVNYSYSVATGWAFGTNRFKRAVPAISKFMWDIVSHELAKAGVLRLEVRPIEKHKFAREWLKKMGFKEETALEYYGSSGETFYQYSLTAKDYRARFKGKMN